MKKRHDVDDLAKQLAAAVSTPLQKVAHEPVVAVQETPPARVKKEKAKVVPVFLSLPESLYQRFDAIAIARTKETGRGVSVQQVILEQLGNDI